MALRAPISFSTSTMATGSSTTPFTATGNPCLNSIVTFSTASGASCGDFVHVHVVGERRVVGIFQLAALVADVQQVAVAAVDLLAALRHRNAVRLGIFEAVFARLQRPLAPRHNDLQLRSQRLVGVLEAHLVVALAGAAVRDGGRAFLQRALAPDTWR